MLLSIYIWEMLKFIIYKAEETSKWIIVLQRQILLICDQILSARGLSWKLYRIISSYPTINKEYTCHQRTWFQRVFTMIRTRNVQHFIDLANDLQYNGIELCYQLHFYHIRCVFNSNMDIILDTAVFSKRNLVIFFINPNLAIYFHSLCASIHIWEKVHAFY